MTPRTPQCRPDARKRAWDLAKRHGQPVYLHREGQEFVIRVTPMPASMLGPDMGEFTKVFPHGETEEYHPR
jgi:hypothetical protein